MLTVQTSAMAQGLLDVRKERINTTGLSHAAIPADWPVDSNEPPMFHDRGRQSKLQKSHFYVFSDSMVMRGPLAAIVIC
jgi:hypothetical protein